MQVKQLPLKFKLVSFLPIVYFLYRQSSFSDCFVYWPFAINTVIKKVTLRPVLTFTTLVKQKQNKTKKLKDCKIMIFHLVTDLLNDQIASSNKIRLAASGEDSW